MLLLTLMWYENKGCIYLFIYLVLFAFIAVLNMYGIFFTSKILISQLH